MNIDTTKIEGFEAMSPEEKVEALLNYEVNDSSDEVTKLKNALNKASADVSEYKKQLKAKQTEEERAASERAEREKEREELLNSLIREKNVNSHIANFLSVGYTEELAKESAEAMEDGNIEAVFKGLKAFLEKHDNDIKVKGLKNMETPPSGGNFKGITKEKFQTMSYAERAKLYEEDPDLYHELKEK